MKNGKEKKIGNSMQQAKGKKKKKNGSHFRGEYEGVRGFDSFRGKRECKVEVIGEGAG